MKSKTLPALLILLASPLALFASSQSDRQIEDAAKASYNYRTVLEDHVKVHAKDGVVTLTGTVADKSDKALAEDTVENLPGVTAVRNEIKVESEYPEHSDSWIALKIRGRLLVKANVSATSTKVDVKDGVVLLTGTAKNVAQKDLTTLYAKEIEGVRSVNNEMVISEKPDTDADKNNNHMDRTVGDRVDDASITAQVKYELLTHRSTSALKTNVTTVDGVVTLTGEASTDAEVSLVTKLAETVRGVRSVNNNMTVKAQ